jgi:hypothetical protein
VALLPRLQGTRAAQHQEIRRQKVQPGSSVLKAPEPWGIIDEIIDLGHGRGTPNIFFFNKILDHRLKMMKHIG